MGAVAIALSLMRVTEPWVLALLPLAAWPWLARGSQPLRYSWLELLPSDPVGDWLHVAMRAIASATIAALVLAIAQPYRAEYPVERVGRGAEIALLLDRSLSMDDPFVPVQPQLGAANLLDLATARAGADEHRPTKGQVAQRILAHFVAQRPDDRFSTQFFSTLPIRVHDFTSKQEVVQAAIAAGSVGEALAETEIGLALLRALDSFADSAYRGSRVIVLVSDGNDYIDTVTRLMIADAMRASRVSLYWIYIRSPHSPTLDEVSRKAADPIVDAFRRESVLHRFFGSMGVPYRAYQADDAKSLEAAVADVGRLEKSPISRVETVPRRDLSGFAYAAALGGLLLLLATRALELRSWA